MEDDITSVDTHADEIYAADPDKPGELDELFAFGGADGVQRVSGGSSGPDLGENPGRSVEANGVDLAIIDTDVAGCDQKPM